MAGIPHDHYEPKTKGEKWLSSRLPIVGLLYDTIMIPTPKKLELDVDLGDRFNLLPCPTNYNWDCLGNALHSARGYGVCFG
jgi:hypothetical protein